MMQYKPFSRKVISAVAVAVCLTHLTYHPSAQARPVTQLLQEIFAPQPQQGTPKGRRRGGAIRGACASLSGLPLTAVVPKDRIGLTTEAHPTFLFYVPYKRTEDLRYAEFVLLDENEREVLQQPILVELPASVGFAKLKLPKNEQLWQQDQALEIGKQYRWYFSVLCNSEDFSGNPYVTGQMQRVAISADMQDTLSTSASTRQRSEIYIKNGIAYEIVAELAENRDRFPGDWATLVRAIDLQTVANAPISELRPIENKNQ